MQNIVRQLQALLPHTTFLLSDKFYWSPKTKTIYIDREALPTKEGRWALLHEAGHAKLQHTSYNSDIDLLQLEVAAWHKAQQIADTLSLAIDQDHIQDCLDTYRDWLHERSTCPRCSIVTFQKDSRTYQCYNCRNLWTVSSSRFCRPYRLSSKVTKNRPRESSRTVFD